LTYDDASNITTVPSNGRLVFTGTGVGGYQSGAGNVRFFDITNPSHLNIVNENIRTNNGVFSFRLQRFCTTGSTRVTASAYGVSFPGTAVGNVTYYSLSPSQLSSSQLCDPNATCEGGQCICNPGYVGDGRTCTLCYGSNVCGANYACPGGATCNTTCNPGYQLVASACVPVVTKIATVQQEAPAATCFGTQVGTYASSLNAVTCNANCSAGRESGNALCGTSLGVNTACCSRPSMFWSALPYADSTPSTNIRAYPFISVPVMVRAARV